MLSGIAIVPGMRILRTGGFTALPWKNGLGVSRVIASDPPGAGYDAVLWQVGTTAITADCPFSSLPGTDRQFTLLEGNGVELSCSAPAEGVNLTKAVDTPYVPFAFRGDWKTDCRLLDGVVQVFNVMTRRGRAKANLRIQAWDGALPCEQFAGETLLAVMLSGTAAVAGETAPLVPNDTLLLDSPAGERCEIQAAASGARIAIVRLAAS
jgi:environmental stress-induced protein Ves